MLTINDYKNKDENNNDEVRAKQITLDFAYMCLKNAYNLLPSSSAIFAKCMKATTSSPSSSSSPLSSKLGVYEDDNEEREDVGEQSELFSPAASLKSLPPSLGLRKQAANCQAAQLKHKLFNCVWPSRPLNIAQLQNLRSSILISLSYCALCLRDYHSAVKYSSMVLDEDETLNTRCAPSPGNRYLAHSYLAEAQLYLDKITESIEHLNINSRIETDNDISFVPTSISSISDSTANESAAAAADPSNEEFYFRSISILNYLFL